MNMFEIIAMALMGSTLLMSMLFIVDQIRLRKLQQKITQQETLMNTLKADIQALFTGAVGEDNRIYMLEKKARRIIERQEQFENSKHAERPYEQAIRMVQKGSSVKDLMAVCNLSQGEADLIMMLHSNSGTNNDGRANDFTLQ